MGGFQMADKALSLELGKSEFEFYASRHCVELLALSKALCILSPELILDLTSSQ